VGCLHGRVVLSRSIVRTTAIDLRLSDRMISSVSPLSILPRRKRTVSRTGWMDWKANGTTVGNRRFASYSNLKPGRYIFRVKAANNDGYERERRFFGRPASSRRSGWPGNFKASSWWGFSRPFFIAVRRRIRAIPRPGRPVEQKVASRTAELRDEIAVRHNAEVELDRRKKYLEAVLFNSTNAIVATDATQPSSSESGRQKKSSAGGGTKSSAGTSTTS